ncbi:MAG: hypothetical protein H6Q61_789 [Firmicutes bacterium]|nr:hypothetical protein [Bacillota bacterium]
MEFKSDAVSLLLHRSGLSPSAWDLETLTRLNLAQMRIGFYGGASSIPVHPTWLTPSGSLPKDAPVAVALVDEREIRCALVTFTEEGPTVEPGDSFPVPGGEYPAPLEDLLFAVAELIEPLLTRASGVILSLSLPLILDSTGDRHILSLPPGLALSGWENAPLAAGLHRELESRGYAPLPVLAVPTVASVLLDGVAAQSGSRYLGGQDGWHRASWRSFPSCHAQRSGRRASHLHVPAGFPFLAAPVSGGASELSGQPGG